MAVPGLTFGGGGGFDFGDFQGGSVYTGPLSVDARTSTSGATATQITPLVLIAAAAVVAVLVLRR